MLKTKTNKKVCGKRHRFSILETVFCNELGRARAIIISAAVARTL